MTCHGIILKIQKWKANDANIFNYMPKVNRCLFLYHKLGKKKKRVTIAPDTMLSLEFKSRFCLISRPTFLPLHILLLGFRLTWLLPVSILQFDDRLQQGWREHCMQNKDNCFPKFTLLFPRRFPPTALPRERWVGLWSLSKWRTRRLSIQSVNTRSTQTKQHMEKDFKIILA